MIKMSKFDFDISAYKANDLKALKGLIIPLFISVVGCYLSLFLEIWIYISGQILLSIFFLQTFILLHECGHLNYFKTRSLNIIFGHFFGLMTLIPFFTWQNMHNLHHKWTGWRDKDPTTEKTVKPQESIIMRALANVAWLFFIPLFYLSYKLSNYWNLLKINRHLNHTKLRVAAVQVILYFTTYVLCIILFPYVILKFILPAFVLSLVWKELVIMTQHSHIEIPISKGQNVKPIAYSKQIQYTRSFYINNWIAHNLLFNFNLHEIHHVYPGLPAYFLSKVDLGLTKHPRYYNWFKQAKSMKGEDYVFRTSKHTGKKF